MNESGGSTTDEEGRMRNQDNLHGFRKFKEKFLPGIRLTLVIALIFYIAMFGIGIWGINKCPVEEYIPFFLIVTGGIGLFSKTITLIREHLLKHTKNAQHIESALYTVEIVFLIFGSWWVLKEYQPNYSPSSTNPKTYCNKTVYILAFVYLILNYAVLLILFSGFCCFLCCIYFVKATEYRQNIDGDAEAQNQATQQESLNTTTNSA